jgi:hypothetical protein
MMPSNHYEAPIIGLEDALASIAPNHSAMQLALISRSAAPSDFAMSLDPLAPTPWWVGRCSLRC